MTNPLRGILPPSAPALLAIAALVPLNRTAAQSVTTVSWGGSYGRAVNEGVNIRFTETTGIRVIVEDYNGGLAQIRAQVDVGNIHWDVVDLEIADAVRGCDDKIPGEKPRTMADFFDLEKFPGRRAMRRVPHVNLEFALIADGVPLDEVYATLDTPEGLSRAFRKLDTIKDRVVWWEASAQPPQMLADGEVVMSTAYNGRIFNAQVLENQPFVIVWDGQLLDVGVVGVVAGTPRMEEALRYLAFATSAESQARLGRRISYSPARRSGAPLVTTHVTAGVEMAPHMPASPENAKRALRYDWAWWVDNQDEMNERFSAWLAR